MDTAILIPAYEPDEKLINLVKALTALPFPLILVVDDGSSEECAGIFSWIEKRPNCEVLHHAKNLGKGAALKTGFRALLNRGQRFTGCVTVDADGQHRPEDILRVAAVFEEQKGALVLGCRDFSGCTVPPKSKFGNTLTRAIYRLLTPQAVSDTQTGLRAIPFSALEDFIHIPGDRYEFEMNMLFEAAKNGMPIQEVTIQTVYFDQNKASHFRPFRDSLRVYKQILQFGLSSLLSFGIDIGLFSLLYNLFSSNGVTWSLLGATAFARLVSSVFNFTVNKRFVFRSKDSTLKQAVQYYLLCAAQMLTSWLILKEIASPNNAPVVVLKILTDAFLFFTSYFVQHLIVFRSKNIMKQKKQPSKRTPIWTVTLILIMILSTTFTLLDAFVIPRVYAAVEPVSSSVAELSDPDTGSAAQTEEPAGANEIQEAALTSSNSQSAAVQTEAVTTENSYADNQISIQVDKVEKNGVVFYVADIQIADVQYLKTAFANDTFGKNITQTTSAMAEANNAILAINGDYYGFRNSGLVIRNGVLYRDFSGTNEQSLVIDSNGDLKVVSSNETTGAALVEQGILQSFTFGPLLVEDGQVAEIMNSKTAQRTNPRTAIGQISPLHYLFIVVDGRSNESRGMTLEQLAQEFADRGATIAYNLDGGGSSAMYLNGEVINNPTDGHYDGERKISDIVYIGY